MPLAPIQIEFAGPPPDKMTGPRRTRYTEAVTALAEKPRNWGRVKYANPGSAHSIATLARKGEGAFRGRKWDATVRTIEGDTFLYLRCRSIGDRKPVTKVTRRAKVSK